MVALRNRPLAAFTGSFWFSALCAVLAPTSIGYQDLAAYLAGQPGVSERWRDHLIASPFGTIHAATFSFSRPIGTTLSEPVGAQTVNLDPRSLDVKVWFGNSGSPLAHPPLQVEYPSVNRRLKGNRMPVPEPASTLRAARKPCRNCSRSTRRRPHSRRRRPRRPYRQSQAHGRKASSGSTIVLAWVLVCRSMRSEVCRPTCR